MLKLSRIAILAGCLTTAAGAKPEAASDKPLAIAATDKILTWGPCPPIFSGACKIAVLHGDPAKANADILLKVDAGAALPRHRHTSAERMILVDGQMRVTYEGAAEVTLTPGNYAYGPAGLPHSARCDGKAPCYLFIAFEGPVDAELVP